MLLSSLHALESCNGAPQTNAWKKKHYKDDKERPKRTTQRNFKTKVCSNKHVFITIFHMVVETHPAQP